MGIYSVQTRTVQPGANVGYRVIAPAGMLISGVYIPHMWSQGLNDGNGWVGNLFWLGGSTDVATFDGESGWSSAFTGSPAFTWPAGGSPYFGWQIACFQQVPCTNGGFNWLSVELLELNMAETVGPAITAAGGLWGATGWIRGSWPLSYSGDSPSGLCGLSASLNGIAIPGATSGRDPSVFHQCSSPGVQQTIDTSGYGNGTLPMTLSASDAAGLAVNYASSVHVDNVPVALSMSGSTDAPSTAGTQYITATATAGPSGVNGIECSVDGSPYQLYPGSSTQLPVQGVGTHQASCFARNNALDANGGRATSPAHTWTVSIRDPAVASVAFTRAVAGLRCVKKHKRVRIPAHWSTTTYHGHKVRVHVPAQTRTITIVHCHRPATQPGAAKTSKRIAYGATTPVSGWVGTVNGTALGGVPVRVMTAPDNGSLRFTQAASATTAADGSWTADLPAGPSRLVEAVYAGGTTSEPATSAPASVIVPASVSLRIRPRRTHWTSTIKISGRVLGGYIPPAGELLILRIGWHGGSTEIGHVTTDATGRFKARYTFLRGNGTVTYRLWATTAHESDYPFVPSRSRKVAVTVRP
jgi:hypothetical protein